MNERQSKSKKQQGNTKKCTVKVFSDHVHVPSKDVAKRLFSFIIIVVLKYILFNSYISYVPHS